MTNQDISEDNLSAITNLISLLRNKINEITRDFLNLNTSDPDFLNQFQSLKEKLSEASKSMADAELLWEKQRKIMFGDRN